MEILEAGSQVSVQWAGSWAGGGWPCKQYPAFLAGVCWRQKSKWASLPWQLPARPRAWPAAPAQEHEHSHNSRRQEANMREALGKLEAVRI